MNQRIVQDFVRQINAAIDAHKQEIQGLEGLRDHVLGFEQRSSGNAPMLSLLTNAKVPPEPKVRPAIATINNRFLYRLALRNAGGPLRANEVWQRAHDLGANSDSANPRNATDAALRDMIGRGVKMVGRGLYAYDSETAPTEDEAQAAT